MRVCYSDGRPSKWIDEDNMTDKTFSDDDLKRLKEYVERLRGLKVSTMATVDTSRLMLLITRLEAAELCAGFYAMANPNADTVVTWRKAAGK